jgi:hypothetical protein
MPARPYNTLKSTLEIFLRPLEAKLRKICALIPRSQATKVRYVIPMDVRGEPP